MQKAYAGELCGADPDANAWACDEPAPRECPRARHLVLPGPAHRLRARGTGRPRDSSYRRDDGDRPLCDVCSLDDEVEHDAAHRCDR